MNVNTIEVMLDFHNNIFVKNKKRNKKQQKLTRRQGSGRLRPVALRPVQLGCGAQLRVPRSPALCGSACQVLFE